MGEEPAAAAVAALNLVKNQHHAGLLGDLTKVSHELVIRDDDTADPLDAFNDYSGDIALGKFCSHRLYVIQRQESDIVMRVERR